VPDLKASQLPHVIGLSGRIAVGKTTAARVIERKGFAYTRFSLVIDDEIRARGLQLDRPTRQRIGLEIHEQRGQAWLCEQALNRVGDAHCVVVDGLRWPEDRAFFVERFGNRFVHLHLDAPFDMRLARTGDGSSEQRSAFEIADAQPVEARIDALKRFASHFIDNDSSLEQFELEVDRFVESVSMGTK
jgi:dephospho-CoA kinase